MRRKTVLPEIRKTWRLSERRACEILVVNRRAARYRSVRADVDAALRMRIKDIATTRIRYGQRRIHVLLRREGWHVNIKRVARIYRAEGLSIRIKTPRRRRAVAVREQPPILTAPNQSWAMDFMHDVLADGSKIRLRLQITTGRRGVAERRLASRSSPKNPLRERAQVHLVTPRSMGILDV